MGVSVSKVTIPVAAGRNLAVLVEAAVRNHVLQLRGIDSTREFIAAAGATDHEEPTDASTAPIAILRHQHARCSSSSSPAFRDRARASRSKCWKTAATTTIDNLPAKLLPGLVEFLRRPATRASRSASTCAAATRSTSCRGRSRELKARGIDVRVLFLDAKTDTLLKRFSETRRRHPLSDRRVDARRMHRARARAARRHRRACRTTSTPAS